MHAFRRHTRLLVVWTLAISAVTLANPLGAFGWLELAAALLPLSLLVDRRLHRELALAIGIPALTLLWLVAPGDVPILRLLTAWAIYGVGVWLAARAVDSLVDLESIAGRVSFAHVDEATEEDLRLALDRELGRVGRVRDIAGQEEIERGDLRFHRQEVDRRDLDPRRIPVEGIAFDHDAVAHLARDQPIGAAPDLLGWGMRGHRGQRGEGAHLGEGGLRGREAHL